MKKITLLLGALSLILGVKAQTFSDSFEADTLGMLGPQSDRWTTWSKKDGGKEDVQVVNTDNHTAGGSKSIHFFSDSANGGPTDVILPFNTVPLTSGKFSFSAWFKIPQGKKAYFNFQGDTVNGEVFTFECELNEVGDVIIKNGTDPVFATTHPIGVWFKLAIDVNLNTQKWGLSIDGVLKGNWKNNVNQIVAVDFFPPDELAEFWVDDVNFTITPYVLPNVNGAAYAVTIPFALVGQKRNLPFTARNLGKAPITSFDLSIFQNGNAPVKETITGVNIPSNQMQTVTMKTPITILADTNRFVAVISNVNGAGVDGDAIDDTTSTITIVTPPAAGKVVFAEGLTGTWCAPCPRTAVFTDFMMKNYSGYYAPISAHLSKDTVSKDPMSLKGYDAQFFGTTSLPIIVLERSSATDPTAIEENFLKAIQIAPEGVLVNGAAYNPATRELKVSITTTIKQNITGDYKVACILTEDSVSGTTPDFNQKNVYAGGTYGEMGGYELLPNPVPAALMNYNYVPRTFSPNLEGFSNAYGASASAGQIITHNFVYILPAAWDVNQLHIIGAMITPTRSVTNASYTSVKQAIINGFIPGILVGINTIAKAPDDITLAPNPVSDLSYISMSLKTESTVSVHIYNVNGALVAEKDYGKLQGAYRLPIEAQQLSKGMYFVRVSVNNQPTVLKLVKE